MYQDDLVPVNQISRTSSYHILSLEHTLKIHPRTVKTLIKVVQGLPVHPVRSLSSGHQYR